MLFMAFISWWYGAGWSGTVKQTQRHLAGLSQNFSIAILITTLFAPWKQMDAFGGVSQSLGDKFRRSVDKFISRFVGFMVRSMTLLAAIISVSVLLLFRLVWIAIWPCLPLMIPAALLYGAGVIG
jgi:hypothetical protein